MSDNPKLFFLAERGFEGALTVHVKRGGFRSLEEARGAIARDEEPNSERYAIVQMGEIVQDFHVRRTRIVEE